MPEGEARSKGIAHSLAPVPSLVQDIKCASYHAVHASTPAPLPPSSPPTPRRSIHPIFNLGVLLRNAKSETKDVGAVDEFPLNLVDHVTSAAGSSGGSLQLIKLAEKGEACGKAVSERNGDPADPAVNCMEELRKVTVVEDMLQASEGGASSSCRRLHRPATPSLSPLQPDGCVTHAKFSALDIQLDDSGDLRDRIMRVLRFGRKAYRKHAAVRAAAPVLSPAPRGSRSVTLDVSFPPPIIVLPPLPLCAVAAGEVLYLDTHRVPHRKAGRERPG